MVQVLSITFAMLANHSQFIDAIRDRKLVRVVFYSLPDAGTVDRECAPLDYGPGPGEGDAQNRYWVWDAVGSAGPNPLGLLPDQVVQLQVLGKEFAPAELVPDVRTWHVVRDWEPPPGPGSPPVVTPAGPR